MLGEFPCLLPCLCGYREGVASVALHIYPPPPACQKPNDNGLFQPPGAADEGRRLLGGSVQFYLAK